MFTPKRSDRRRTNAVRRVYAWLFEDYNAVVLLAKPYKQVLDYADVTVAVSDLLLQFTRSRDESHVSIAPSREPDDWYELGEAIDLASDVGGTGESAGSYTMSDFERLFRANIERLKVLFSQREFARTSRRRFAKRKSRLSSRFV